MQKKVLIALKMAGVAGQEKLGGIFRYLGADHDWKITLVRTAGDFTCETVRDAIEGGYDGFIVSIPNTEHAAAELAATNAPTVVMDIHEAALESRSENIVFLRNSAQEIAKAAAHHLVSLGRCRSYAYVHAREKPDWSVARADAFREILYDSGHWCHMFDSPEGLGRLKKPIGVFAANDDTGFNVLSYCASHDLVVPDDVAVIGNDNDALICENAQPRLTSVQPDFGQEGFLAAQCLDALMRCRTPRHVPRETRYVGVKAVVRRDSTFETSPSGKLVQKALAFIRENALNGITVEAVAAYLGCSRRLLDLRFHELQQASVGQTIIELRLDEVCERLATTREPIDTIAAECGYTNVNHLRNLFRRRFGCSMSDWRLKNARQ